jgi:hypothetical protein
MPWPVGVQTKTNATEDINWDALEARISALNSVTYTFVTLHARIDEILVLGGGPSKYPVYISSNANLSTLQSGTTGISKKMQVMRGKTEASKTGSIIVILLREGTGGAMAAAIGASRGFIRTLVGQNP